MASDDEGSNANQPPSSKKRSVTYWLTMDDPTLDDPPSPSAGNDPPPGETPPPPTKKRKLPAPPNPNPIATAKEHLQWQLLNAQNEYAAWIYSKSEMREQLTLKEQVMLLAIPNEIKEIILNRVDELVAMGPTTSEYSKSLAWIKLCMKLPFGVVRPPLPHSDRTDFKIREFLARARLCMDQAIYGQERVKKDIVAYIAGLITGNCAGKVLTLSSPPGYGKTRLVRLGLANALQYPFFSINCGGLNEEAFLIGHSYTYVGAKPGVFAKSLAQAGRSNFLCYVDEVDKIVHSNRTGIYGVLTHALDPEQNHAFQDLYVGAEIPLDLSKILFVLSVNEKEAIPSVTRDRMRLIEMEQYTNDDKREIMRRFVVPEGLRDIGLTAEDVLMENDALDVLVKEATAAGGMRNVKRAVQTVLERINLWRYDATDALTDKPIMFPFRADGTLVRAILDSCNPSGDAGSIPHEIWRSLYS